MILDWRLQIADFFMRCQLTTKSKIVNLKSTIA